ncbi:helix-turn-helix domain-containing protein [Leucobacter celer]|uniref:hypothetical protein n=1 Tax=Leucobacter celer TaxID=668625 RepID=UPI00138EEA11|nr:hypothetical protein [Leucobacter celer]
MSAAPRTNSANSASAVRSENSASAVLDTRSRDLLLRLLRGTPRSLEGIRGVAQPGVDLAESLTRLEDAGFVTVEPGGLGYAVPSEITRARAAESLAQHRARVAIAREALRSLGAATGAPTRRDPAAGSAVLPVPGPAVPGPAVPGPAVPGPAVPADAAPGPEGAPVLHLAAGDAALWWRTCVETGLRGMRLAIPRLSRMRREFDELVRELETAPVESAPGAAPGGGAELLVGSDALEDPDGAELLQRLSRLGITVRVLRRVPGWLGCDPSGRTVLSAASAQDPVSGLVTTEDPALAGALGEVFDTWWRWGIGYPFAGPQRETILALREQGHEDQECAAILGLSVRTVQRIIAELMDEIGARSRFELGVWWARRVRAAEAPGGPAAGGPGSDPGSGAGSSRGGRRI